MKDVGILTFHRASNYGAVLQAYALYKALNKFGIDCEIINYKCDKIEKSHTILGLFQSVEFKQAIIRAPQRTMKYRTFDKFRKRQFCLGKELDKSTIEGLKKEYKVFIVGSDQVWSDKFAGFDETYFLTFADDERKFSYAASFGFDKFPMDLKKEYLERLRMFYSVSVREDNARLMLENEEIVSRVDVDPTFLLDTSEWKLFSSTINRKEKYILVYTVQTPIHLLDKAKQLSNKTGIQIIYLNNEHRANRELKHVRYASPEAFVSWFENAEYVFTNSFHGTAFSIIFQKRYKVEIETEKGINYRSKDLIERLKLENSALDEHDSFVFDYDWKTANQVLKNLREDSLLYLKSICEYAGNCQ